MIQLAELSRLKSEAMAGNMVKRTELSEFTTQTPSSRTPMVIRDISCAPCPDRWVGLDDDGGASRLQFSVEFDVLS